MLIALAVAHIGRVRSKKATTDAARFKSAAIFYGVAMVIMLLSIQRALRALGSGDGGPGGGMVGQRRDDLRGRRVIFAIVALAGLCGAITQVALSQL